MQVHCLASAPAPEHLHSTAAHKAYIFAKKINKTQHKTQTFKQRLRGVHRCVAGAECLTLVAHIPQRNSQTTQRERKITIRHSYAFLNKFPPNTWLPHVQHSHVQHNIYSVHYTRYIRISHTCALQTCAHSRTQTLSNHLFLNAITLFSFKDVLARPTAAPSVCLCGACRSRPSGCRAGPENPKAIASSSLVG